MNKLLCKLLFLKMLDVIYSNKDQFYVRLPALADRFGWQFNWNLGPSILMNI